MNNIIAHHNIPLRFGQPIPAQDLAHGLIIGHPRIRGLSKLKNLPIHVQDKDRITFERVPESNPGSPDVTPNTILVRS
jgi:hypothetical protein